MSNSGIIQIFLAVFVPLTAYFYKIRNTGRMFMVLFGITVFITVLLLVTAIVLWIKERPKDKKTDSRIPILAGIVSLVLTLAILWGVDTYFPVDEPTNVSEETENETVDNTGSEEKEDISDTGESVSDPAEKETDSTEEQKEDTNVEDNNSTEDDAETGAADKSRLYIAENKDSEYSWSPDECCVADVSNVPLASDGHKHLSLYYYEKNFETARLISSHDTDNRDSLLMDLAHYFDREGYYFFYVLTDLTGTSKETFESEEYLQDRNTSTIVFYKKPEKCLDTVALYYDKVSHIIRWENVEGARYYDIRIDAKGNSSEYSHGNALVENEFSLERDITGLKTGTEVEISVRAVSNDITLAAHGDYSEPIRVTIP